MKKINQINKLVSLVVIIFLINCGNKTGGYVYAKGEKVGSGNESDEIETPIDNGSVFEETVDDLEDEVTVDEDEVVIEEPVDDEPVEDEPIDDEPVDDEIIDDEVVVEPNTPEIDEVCEVGCEVEVENCAEGITLEFTVDNEYYNVYLGPDSIEPGQNSNSWYHSDILDLTNINPERHNYIALKFKDTEQLGGVMHVLRDSVGNIIDVSGDSVGPKWHFTISEITDNNPEWFEEVECGQLPAWGQHWPNWGYELGAEFVSWHPGCDPTTALDENERDSVITARLDLDFICNDQ